MKTLLVIFLLGAAASSPVFAADWTHAGGRLFARPDVAEASSDKPTVQALAEETVASPVEPFAGAIEAAARAHGLDPKLLHALVIVESAYHARARSRAGAMGLSQLMPATAILNGAQDAYDPRSNLEAGARYLAAQIKQFGDLRLALAAYNAGPARVAKAQDVPPIAETRAYVAAVVDCYLALTAGRSPRSAATCRGRHTN